MRKLRRLNGVYTKEILGFKEARIVGETIFAEVTKENKGPIAVAVVDDLGELIYFARMDKSRPVSGYMAINKAYTSARRRINTRDLLELGGADLTYFGDNKLTMVQGGVYIKKRDGTPLGAVGVAGLPGEREDEEFALKGLQVLDL
jgi:uncharacterized protein GlcG (DUF336 family)